MEKIHSKSKIKENIKNQFHRAKKDKKRNKEIKLWDSISSDGLNEDNNYKINKK